MKNYQLDDGDFNLITIKDGDTLINGGGDTFQGTYKNNGANFGNLGIPGLNFSVDQTGSVNYHRYDEGSSSI
jgi:hypothetical protein